MKKRKRTLLYVGYAKKPQGGIARTLFRSSAWVTLAEDIKHGELYFACIGPFRTLAGAQFCADYEGVSYQTVAEFEHAARHTG